MSISLPWMVLVIGVGFVAIPSPAAAMALDFPAPTENITSFGAYSMGWQFHTNASVTVRSLAFFDDYGNGLYEAHDVGIFDALGNLLASATVLPSDPLFGTAPWRAHAISPVTLAAGQDYFIAAATGFFDNYTFDPAGLWTIPQITYIQSQYSDSLVLTFPTYSDFHTGYFGANFGVPEASTFTLVAIAFVVAGALRAKRLLRP